MGIYLLRPLRPVPCATACRSTTALIITVSRRSLLPRRQSIPARSTLHVGIVAQNYRQLRAKTRQTGAFRLCKVSTLSVRVRYKMHHLTAQPRHSDHPRRDLQMEAHFLLAGTSGHSSLLDAIEVHGDLLQVTSSSALLKECHPVVRCRTSDPARRCTHQGATSFEFAAPVNPAGWPAFGFTRQRSVLNRGCVRHQQKQRTVASPTQPRGLRFAPLTSATQKTERVQLS